MKFTNDHETILETDDEYREVYLDWRNSFLTATRFADYYGWSESVARQVIEKGRALHESEVTA